MSLYLKCASSIEHMPGEAKVLGFVNGVSLSLEGASLEYEVAQDGSKAGITFQSSLGYSVHLAEPELNELSLQHLKRLSLSLRHLFRTRENLELVGHQQLICLHRQPSDVFH